MRRVSGIDDKVGHVSLGDAADVDMMRVEVSNSERALAHPQALGEGILLDHPPFAQYRYQPRYVAFVQRQALAQLADRQFRLLARESMQHAHSLGDSLAGGGVGASHFVLLPI